jgi:hypothetical protein
MEGGWAYRGGASVEGELSEEGGEVGLHGTPVEVALAEALDGQAHVTTAIPRHLREGQGGGRGAVSWRWEVSRRRRDVY